MYINYFSNIKTDFAYYCYDLQCFFDPVLMRAAVSLINLILTNMIIIEFNHNVYTLYNICVYMPKPNQIVWCLLSTL